MTEFVIGFAVMALLVVGGLYLFVHNLEEGGKS